MIKRELFLFLSQGAITFVLFKDSGLSELQYEINLIGVIKIGAGLDYIY